MMQIMRMSPHDDPRWGHFVESHPRALVFHHPLWIRVLEETYGYRQASLACVEQEVVVGVLPLLEIASRLTGKRAVCLPFSDYAYPLIRRAAALDVLLDACEQQREEHHWNTVEIRASIAHPAAFPSARYFVHQLPLRSDPDAVFRTFTKGRTQAAIKQCERYGVIIERRTDAGAMAQFRQLNYRTRKKHGLPPQPDRFFDNVHRLLLSAGFGFVSIAMFEGAPIAASVFLHYQGKLYHKFNASDERFLRVRPNHGILWDAIRWGCLQGFHRIDLGRSDLEGEGLLHYKRGWGTTESDLEYFRFSGGTPAAPASQGGMLEAMKPILQHMPIPVLRVLGNILYEHVG